MATLAFFGRLGPLELLLILGVVMLLFGRRIPDVARSLGRGIVEFKRGLSGVGDDEEEDTREKPPLPGSEARPSVKQEVRESQNR